MCFQGILVHYTAASASRTDTFELETFVQPIKHYKIIKPVGPINRLKMLQVGCYFVSYLLQNIWLFKHPSWIFPNAGLDLNFALTLNVPRLSSFS